MSVRLACLIHAVSIQSELRSNSQKDLLYILTGNQCYPHKLTFLKRRFISAVKITCKPWWPAVRFYSFTYKRNKKDISFGRFTAIDFISFFKKYFFREFFL
jgi:hypothetical protein